MVPEWRGRWRLIGYGARDKDDVYAGVAVRHSDADVVVKWPSPPTR